VAIGLEFEILLANSLQMPLL